MTRKATVPPTDDQFYTTENYAWQSSTGHLVASAHMSLRRVLETELARFGDVSSAQWIVMMILSHQDDVTAASLAKRLSYDPGSMTRLLDRLQDKGLVRRTRTHDDRRCIQIELTESGQALKPTLPTAAINAINRSLSGFTPAEHEQLNRLLTRMIDNLR